MLHQQTIEKNTYQNLLADIEFSLKKFADLVEKNAQAFDDMHKLKKSYQHDKNIYWTFFLLDNNYNKHHSAHELKSAKETFAQLKDEVHEEKSTNKKLENELEKLQYQILKNMAYETRINKNISRLVQINLEPSVGPMRPQNKKFPYITQNPMQIWKKPEAKLKPQIYQENNNITRKPS